MLKSLPYTQMLRARRIVTDKDEVEDTLEQMATTFRERGYPKALVETHKPKVLGLDRQQLLVSKHPQTKVGRLPFISTYNELSPKIANILGKHWPIIGDSFPQIEGFKIPPLMSYRRSQNLKDLWVKTDIGKQQGNR